MANDESGKKPNVEGRHGDKTHEAFLDNLQGNRDEIQPQEGKPIAGHHRLHEDRQQHDEAEKNSEANRLRR